MTECPKCRAPQVGNETFCSNCGTRIFGAAGAGRPAGARSRRIKLILTLLGALLLLGLIALASDHFGKGGARPAAGAASSSTHSPLSVFRRIGKAADPVSICSHA